jgi:hypothetical protein
MSTGRSTTTRATPLQVARAVVSAFFGVRKRDDHEAIRLSPMQVLIAGIIGAALFVGTLLLIVNFVLSHAGVSA